MLRSSRFPLLNSLRIIPANDGLAAGINTYAPDRGFFYQQIRRYQPKNLYRQLLNYRDMVTIYLDTMAPDVNVYLYNDLGEEIAGPISVTPSAVVPGNTVVPGGADVYNSYFIKFRMYELLTSMTDSQKIVYVAVESIYSTAGANDSEYFVSEPVWLSKDGWLDTMLLEATHSVNKWDVMFEATGAFFVKRLECDITDDPAPGFDDVVFEDQLNQMRILDSNPLRFFSLIIRNAPRYEIDKVNRMLSCETFAADKVQYTKDEGAKFTIESKDDDPLKSASIQLREYNLTSQGQNISLDFLPLVQLSGINGPTIQYPLGINQTMMIENITHVLVHYTNSVIIEDGAGMTVHLATLNGSFATANGLGGAFSVANVPGVGDFLGYTPVAGESYSKPFVLSYLQAQFSYCTMFSFEVTATATVATPFGIDFRCGPNGFTGVDTGGIIIDWGDGTCLTSFAGTSSVVEYHTWPTPATVYTVRVFHAGSVSSSSGGVSFLNFSRFGTGKMTKILSGDVPVSLKTWNMQSQDLSSGLSDFRILEAARANITWVAIQSCQAPNLNLFFNTGWISLTTLLMNGNNISVTNLNAIINRMATDVSPIVSGGTLTAKQSPAAPPSGSALTHINTLVSVYGWTVSHD